MRMPAGFAITSHSVTSTGFARMRIQPMFCRIFSARRTARYSPCAQVAAQRPGEIRPLTGRARNRCSAFAALSLRDRWRRQYEHRANGARDEPRV